MQKTFIIGLDCAEPSLVFDKFKDDLPNINQLAGSGMSGHLRSCDPPITVPAWSVMSSGKTAGELGVYGFHNRQSFAYGERSVSNSLAIHEKRLWDYVSDHGGKNIVMGVPQTYPPKPLNGYLVSGLLTPSTESDFTFPASFKERLLKYAPAYTTDVKDFRVKAPADLLRDIYIMTDQRFKAAREMLARYEWDFFMLVEIGLDRIQHAFWQYMETDSPFRNAVRNYYRFLDEKIAELLPLVPANVDKWIVSDHGAQSLKCLFRVNQWLLEKDWLVLKSPASHGALKAEMVDWSRTIAWADGGYYGRIYFNVQGREPQGIVPPDEMPQRIDEIKKALGQIRFPHGRIMNTRALTPQELYPKVNGIAPDLIVYFDDLAVRASASLGKTGELFPSENDTGPDGANHAFNGLYILNGPGILPHRKDASIYDVCPTVLSRMGIAPQVKFQGRDITR